MSLNISLNNFRCWEDKNLEIPSSGICLINGRSGRGKSTILNSILYAITGKLKNISTFNKKSTKVILSIDDIKITRTRGPNKLKVERNGKTYDEDNAQTIIDSIFGSEFGNTSYIDQDNVFSFVSLSPTEKIEFLEKLLLSTYNIDKIKDNLREKISSTKNEYISYESKINTLKEILEKMVIFPYQDVFIDKIKLNNENISKIKEKITNNLEISEKNSKIIKNKLKKLEDEKESVKNVIDKRNKLLYFIDKLKEEYVDLNEYYLDKNKKELLKEELYLNKTKRDLYISNKKYIELTNKRKELDTKYNEIKIKNSLEKEKLIEQISLIDKPNKKRISELEKSLDMINRLIEIDDKIVGMNYDEEKTDKEIYDLTKIIDSDKEKLILSQKLLLEIDKCYTCPSCKKVLKINDNKLIEYENSYFDKNNLKKDIQTLKNEISINEKKLSEVNKKQNDYNQKNKEYNDLFDKLTGEFDNDKELIEKEIERLNLNSKSYEDLSRKIQLIENDNLEKQLKNDLENIERLVKNYKDIEDHIENLEEKDYLNYLHNITILTEKISSIESYITKMDLYYKDLEKLESLEMKEIKDKDRDFDLLIKTEKEKLETYEKKIETYREYINNINEWHKTYENNKKYKDLEKDINEYELVKNELNDKTRCLCKLREYVKISEKKCISDFIESLNDHASIYIEQFFPDEDIKVELKTTQETKSTGKEKVCLNFEVNYRQLIGDLSYLSGGERDRVNLAFTLAFSEIINNRILLLDECISSLDSETTNIVLENIKEKYKGKLVILVSHQANLGFFDKVIDI